MLGVVPRGTRGTGPRVPPRGAQQDTACLVPNAPNAPARLDLVALTKERPLVQPLVQPRGIQGDASLAQRRALGVLEDSYALRSAGVTHVCAETYAAQPLILYTEALIKCIPQVLPPFSPRNIAPVNSAQNGCNRVPGKISWQCPAAWFQVEQGYTCGPLRGARSAQE